MAYTPIDNGKIFFNTKLYTGNGGTNAQTGVGFAPDWVWLKQRSGSAASHKLYDAVRGTTKYIASNNTGAEATDSNGLTAFGTDGFTVGSSAGTNANSQTYVGWNWKAAGANPAKTYVVKVVSDGGNKYRLDDFAANAVTLEISEGGTFTFDQSDSSNNGHPLRFSTTSNGTHAGGSIYTTGVTVSGTPGQAGAKTVIIVAASAPTLYYFCTVHSGMGGQANTPTTNSFTNLDGSIQSNISPNTISKFSVITYTGNGASSATIGHGLNSVPKMMIVKRLDASASWFVYHQKLGANNQLKWDNNEASSANQGAWNNTTPTASVFTIGTADSVNASNGTYVAYLFGDVQGFSKMGSYLGNGSTDGAFIYTGFKPSFFMIKRTNTSGSDWSMWGYTSLSGFNSIGRRLFPNTSGAESSQDSSPMADFLSNGVKIRQTDGDYNGDDNTYIYMAFAENPFISAAGIPVTAR